MKFSVLSDLHLDFYFNPSKSPPSLNQISAVFEEYLDRSEEVEVLIVAGDISHYYTQMYILDLIANIFNYKKVFCVLGNHEGYLVSKGQRYMFPHSKDKFQKYWDYHTDVVTVLNGTIEEYKGVKFGGAMGWYDGTYNNPDSPYAHKDPVAYCNQVMNDFSMIKGYTDLYDLVKQERPKFEDILSADVIISHFNPICEPMAFQERYRDDLSSMFYAFDGADIVQRSNAKHWVFGHSHGHHEFEAYGVEFTLNAFGYPREYGAQNIVKEIK